ncbi:alpha/beta fold hydrolase [Beijerinckia sp. L45]|uniref:alpha/beta fold hydrolase n=1 Tax=Beijerinckia sp. L45 TaxID=1641855 RepID=UPI00131D3E04|nr:alpha/beta fold hydrolase [Beijerinckia sp. L45]
MKLAVLLVLCALVIVAAAGLWLYTPDKPRAALEAAYHIAPTGYRDIAGMRMRLADSGPKRAPALILLHGFGSSLETWDAWVKSLAADFRVIRFDWPGFGLTGPDPTGDYSDARSLQILAAVMDALGIDRASLIGNSIGGKLAWMFAAKNPARVDRLVLVSPDGFASPGFDYGKKPEVPLMVRALPYTLPAFMVRASMSPAFGDPTRMDEALVARYRDFMLAPGVRPAMIARMEQVTMVPPEPLLRGVRAPTLLLWGEKDGMIPVANAADYLRTMPDARLAALPGLGHVPQEEAPALSLKPVLDFLRAP